MSGTGPPPNHHYYQYTQPQPTGVNSGQPGVTYNQGNSSVAPGNPPHGYPIGGPPSHGSSMQPPVGQMEGLSLGPNQIGSRPRMPSYPGPSSRQMHTTAPPPMTSKQGTPPTRMGAPPTRMGVPPTGMGAPPTGIGAPPTGIGAPPTRMGAPSTGMGAPPTGMGAPPTGIGAPPTGTGAPPTRMGAPPTGIGAPPTGTGAPPTRMGIPPTGIGAPPTGIGAPPTGTGAPPTRMGAPPTRMGAPPTRMGAPPTGTGAPPTRMGAPPTGMGAPPTGTGAPPTGMAPPTEIGHKYTSGFGLTGPAPPTSMMGAPPTSNMGAPPTSNMGAPPTSNMGAPPTSNMGAPPTSNMGAPPTSMMGSPPTSMMGAPPTSMMGAPPTSRMGPIQPGMPHSGRLINPSGPPNAPFPQQVQVPEELRPVNLLETRNILPSSPLEHPAIKLNGDFSQFQPDPNVFSCSLNAVPVTHSLLSKLKLPLGIHIHPFRQTSSKPMPVLHPNIIVRCRVCRAYINPYVTFIDTRHWRCNLCFRSNDLPDDFGFSTSTGEVNRSHRKELFHSSVEYIASSDYMLRPPQASTYFYVIDVSHNSVASGMLQSVCTVILENLEKIPGDSRTLFGLMTFDNTLHFYNLQSHLSQFQMIVLSDLDDTFLPIPDSLLVNLKESKELIRNLLEELPRMFSRSSCIDSGFGAALTSVYSILKPVGGRISAFLSTIPSMGPGATKEMQLKQSSGQSSVSKEKTQVAPLSDFYKKLALECCAQQIGIDLFLFSEQPVTYSTVACAAQFSSGQIYYYPGYHINKPTFKERFMKDFTHYLTRPIGFEAVMRVRSTTGIGLHAFHGNFFVRSSDLLSLPNVSPDVSYAINLSIDENLKDVHMVCIQAALLYTSSRGERRIKVHTLALPVSDKPADIYASCNVQAITGLLGKMAVDRVTTASLGDAREALTNAVIDCIKSYRTNILASSQAGFLSLPSCLRLFPLFILAMQKHPAFSLDSRTTLDGRADAMNTIKTLPLDALMYHIYPLLCNLLAITTDVPDRETKKALQVIPVRLHSSAEKLQRNGIFLINCGTRILVWVGQAVNPQVIQELFGVSTFGDIPEGMTSLSTLDNQLSDVTISLISQYRKQQPKFMTLHVVKETSANRILVAESLVEDRTEAAFSYQEFLQYIQSQLKK